MLIFRFILGGLLAVGLVNVSHAMSDEVVEKNENLPSRKEVDDITEEIFYRVVIKKGKPLSVDEAKTTLFEIWGGVAEELESKGFDVKKYLPKNPEDIPDEKVNNFLTDFDDHFRDIKVARRET